MDLRDGFHDVPLKDILMTKKNNNNRSNTN